MYLYHTFPIRCIGKESPVPWSPRSPDLTPLDFFCGHFKSLVYVTSVDTEDRLQTTSLVTEQTQGIFERVRKHFYAGGKSSLGPRA
ncbi:hypothetical protein C0J52_24834 [Blattella germanica]|nr:hypothetical protein C0J52_24834 [Blattella germanica]